MKILVTGGSGFIGSALIKFLVMKGYEVMVLTHQQKVEGPGVSNISSLSHLPNNCHIDVIINLAGAPINKLWSPDYKTTLLDSRINITKAIINLIKKMKIKPKLLISASAIGYYGLQHNVELHENSRARVKDFTHSLCAAWENEAQKAREFGVRVCIARLGVVLGNGGGFIHQMLPTFRSGLGGKIGDGKQYISWIHLSDVINIIALFMEDEKYDGIYNVTSPQPITNGEFAQNFASALNRPAFFTVPKFVIKLLFREMGDALILNGMRIKPQKLLDAKYRFLFPDIQSALRDIVTNR